MMVRRRVGARPGGEQRLAPTSAAGLASVWWISSSTAYGPRATIARDRPHRVRSGDAEEGGTGSVIRVSGEVDRTNAHVLSAVLNAAGNGSGAVTVDLSRLSFIDLNGVRALLDVAARLAPGRRLILASPPRALLRILDLTGLGQGAHLQLATPRGPDRAIGSSTDE